MFAKPRLPGFIASAMALIVACSESNKPKPIGLENTGGSSNLGGNSSAGGKTGGKSGGAASAAGSGAGAAGETSSGGSGTGGQQGFAGNLSAAGAPGTGLAGSGGQAQTTPPSCDPLATWANPTPLTSLNTANQETLLDVTKDERTILWLASEGQNKSLWVADRALASDAFGTPESVPLPIGYNPTLGAALSPDALRIILVADAGAGFAELARASRSDAFAATLSTAMFSTLNLIPTTAGQSLSSPVLHVSDNTFYYVGTTQTSAVYESHRVGNAWSVGSPLGTGLLDGTPGQRNLLSSVSDDELTYFYFNEAAGKEQARFRETKDAPLYEVVTYDNLNDARPNSACTRIYYTNTSSGNGDLYFTIKD